MLTKFIHYFIRRFYISKRIIKEQGLKGFINFIIFKVYSKYFMIFIDKKIKKKLDLLINDSKLYDRIMIIISGMKYDENIGNRPTYLTKEFNKKNYLILYVYFTWNKSEETDFGFFRGNSIFLIPLRIFLKNYLYIFKNLDNNCKKILILEAPLKEIFELLSYGNSFNYFTIYDIIDDWEEFHKVGEAPWYSKDLEKYICNNSDLIITVSKGLYDKFLKFSPILVNNAFDMNSFNHNIPIKNLTKGDITLGYFGHLTSSWFDWDLIIEIAKREEKWIFHIIGYGAPERLKVPKNIFLYGRVEREKLPSYVYNWDVAIIPFKKSTLSEHSDPLKIYEYLYLRKPVVVSGISHLSNYPYVYFAKDEDDFIKLTKKAKNVTLDNEILNKFLLGCTWEKRIDNIDNIINGLSVIKKKYLISQWSYR